MAETTQEPLGKVEQMLVDMIDGEPIVEAPENKIQGLLMELADVIAQGGGGGGGGGITKYAQLPDKPRINDVELSGNKSFSQLGLNVQSTPVNGSNDPISSGGVYNALANKVTKETGKSLTSNDFTNALLAKLNAIESGAQVNLIEKILVNGVEVAPSNKAVALTVMTNTVENLVNYYKKSETYSQAEVDQLISQISGGITLEVVEELPETGISTSTIYLIEAGENVYTQYLFSSVDNEWKILGSTTVDLSNYYTKAQVNALLDDKQDTLEYDNAPTASSEKMVKSGGIYNALQAKQDTLEYDNTPTEDSQKMVKSGDIWTALEAKQDTLEWDTVPTAGSTKSLTSGAIKTALDNATPPIATDSSAGIVQPDGDTITVDNDGTIHAPAAVDFDETDFVENSGEISLQPARRTWYGHKATWEALSAAVRKTYGAAVFDDDEEIGVDVYSTTETKTNKVWIDGKPIYRKVVNLGNLPDTGDVTINHNIANIDVVVPTTRGGAIGTNGNTLQMPYVHIANYANCIQFWANKTACRIKTGSGYWVDYTAYAILEYTKTTD